MFSNKFPAFQYTDKGRVLRYLTQIIQKELHYRERCLIYLYCGIGADEPIGWRELTFRFKYDTPEITKRCYYRAVEKVREAIPGTELDRLVAGYNPDPLVLAERMRVR